MIHLLVEPVLPLQDGIEIVGPVGPLAGPGETDAHDVHRDLLQGLAILLIYAQHEERKHDEYHAQRRRTVSQRSLDEKEQRNAEQRTAAKAYQLPFCQVERDFAFDPREVLGDGDVSHFQDSFLMGA